MYRILSLSDVVVSFIYSSQIRVSFSDVDLVLGCGDLPYYYLEYIVSTLDVPLFFVRGNHGKVLEYGEAGTRSGPLGATDLHCRCVNHAGLLLAGVEGSLRYREGPYQYSQGEMWINVLKLVPYLYRNFLFYGRYLDVFISHAPPWGIHDQVDLPHQGIKAFRWLLHVFRPIYHFHGHVHVYRPDTPTKTLFGQTWVVNTYSHRLTDIDVAPATRKR